MALYDLVSLKKALTEQFTIDSVSDELLMLKNRIENIKHQVPILAPEHASYINELIDHYENVIQLATKPYDDLTQRMSLIDSQISVITTNLFHENYELETFDGGFEGIRNNRRIYVNEDIVQLLKTKIQLYTDWKYPALEIGCRDGEWTQYLVAADPLYIIDKYDEFLKSTSSKFAPEYQRRLRPYTLVNHDLSPLPQHQFGFIFSWGYFNYISMDTFKKYLQQVFDLLRDGGVFMFSYNDGDTTAGAGMAENFAQTYVPKSVLIPFIQSLGFEIINDFHNGNNIQWLEIKKPGTLSTVKAHQVMGSIVSF
jgi:SAM-dependent methyltransferase